MPKRLFDPHAHLSRLSLIRPAIAPALFLLATTACAGVPEPQIERDLEVTPHIVVLLADDLGIDIAPCYAPESPMRYLKSLCEQSVIFDRVYTHPYCTPSRAALMTGRHTFRHGADDVRMDIDKLPLAEVTLPEQVKSTSQTAIRFSLFGKWHLADEGNGSIENPNLQGFDHFEGTPRQTFTYDYYGYSWFVNGELVGEQISEYRTEFLTKRVLSDFGSHHEDGPQFSIVSFTNPHLPFHIPPGYELPPPPKRGRIGAPSTPDTYAPNERDHRLDPYYFAMLESLDRAIERIATSVSQVSNRPVIFIFLGDNGSAQEVYRGDVSGGYRAKASLYDGGIRVPMQVWWHGNEEPVQFGRRVEDLVHVVDLFPTFLELTGGSLPNTELDGVSILGALRSEPTRDQREFVFVSRGNDRIVPYSFGSIDADGYKVLVRELDRTEWPSLPSLLTSSIELYDTKADPGETKNLVDHCSPELTRIRNHIDFIDSKLSSEAERDRHAPWDKSHYLSLLKEIESGCER